MIENKLEETSPCKDAIKEEKKKKDKKKSSVQNVSKLISTFFRNALKSNLDLTSLADTKAGILISINGFILTVSVTASSFAIHNSMMTYAFISIILTSLGSIIFAVLAVRPRTKDRLIAKKHLANYESLLYYQDMVDMDPEEYIEHTLKILKSDKKMKREMTSHLYILGSEIQKKYFWLKKAYTFFSSGLIISAMIIIYALTYVEQTPFYNLKKGNVVYKEGKFYNIFEPSGVTTLDDGKILIVEDDGSVKSLKLVEFTADDKMVELGNLYIPKKLKKRFKKVEDLEAVTSKAGNVYAITSHSLTREGKRKKAREKLIMFKYDDAMMVDLYEYVKLKDDLIQAFPRLFKNMFKIDDMDIEGLTLDNDGGLLIGFRSPLSNFKAMLIKIKNPQEVLQRKAQPVFETPIFLDLGGLGIRDISYDEDKNGFWIIAGDVNERGENFKLYFWNKETGEISYVKNQPDIGFGEGVAVIHNHGKSSLFIVEDDGRKPNQSADYVIINRDSL